MKDGPNYQRVSLYHSTGCRLQTTREICTRKMNVIVPKKPLVILVMIMIMIMIIGSSDVMISPHQNYRIPATAMMMVDCIDILHTIML